MRPTRGRRGEAVMAHPDDDQIVSGHPDEGTIHAWLDGQLSSGDAERVETHVAACVECRARVAEARGFIAASSRILTALDGVPARVVPMRRRGVQVWHVRAAAAVLIVALGTATVLRNAGRRVVSHRVAVLSDSQRQASPVARGNEADKPVAPVAAPPATVLSKEPVLREEMPAAKVSKAAPPVGEPDENQVSGLRDRGSEAAANASRAQAENKERAAMSSVTAGAPVSPPAAASAGVAGGVAAQRAVQVPPATIGGGAMPEAAAASVEARRMDAIASSACVGQVVSVSTSSSSDSGARARRVVRLESSPSTDSLSPDGFALGAPADTGTAPRGDWTPLGSDSAIVSVPSEGDREATEKEGRSADSVASDAFRDRQTVRTRVQCRPR